MTIIVEIFAKDVLVTKITPNRSGHAMYIYLPIYFFSESNQSCNILKICIHLPWHLEKDII